MKIAVMVRQLDLGHILWCGRMGRVLRVLLGDVVDFRNHADTRMTEKHYAHLAPSYVADTIRAHFPTLGITDAAVVTTIGRRPGGLRK